MRNPTAKQLAEIIRANPGAVLEVDNDGWALMRKNWKDPGPPDFGVQYNPEEGKWFKWAQLASGSDSPARAAGGLLQLREGEDMGASPLVVLAQMAGIEVCSI